MFSCQSNSAISMTFALVRSENPVYAHTCVVPRVRNSTQCIYCSNRIRSSGV